MSTPDLLFSNAPPPSPQAARNRLIELAAMQKTHRRELETARLKQEKVREELALAPKVEEALKRLSDQLFADLLDILEEKLSVALREVLEQPIRLCTERDFKRGAACIDFYIERDGQHEHIMRGQGGSVVNILSVGLRMFALANLPPQQHRRFLLLDEPDCWLQPELVPRLIKLIHDASNALGFQTLLISHHDVSAFERYADRIYAFSPNPDGTVRVEKRPDLVQQAD
ncbi:MAG: ATP-binding protein [Gemmataceae bacterium]|nr:ATP-binding protein [Gemmataceae bacterium]MCI0743431.1 ATP-binding protein [Gemmataceae bacterium]